MNKGENTYPLWIFLSPDDQVKLISYQWNCFGYRLCFSNYEHPLITYIPAQGSILHGISSIDRFMQQKPRYSRTFKHGGN